jgi:hypothetical protein
VADPLVLPEEFALLSLADAGKVIGSTQASGRCAAPPRSCCIATRSPSGA